MKSTRGSAKSEAVKSARGCAKSEVVPVTNEVEKATTGRKASSGTVMTAVITAVLTTVLTAVLLLSFCRVPATAVGNVKNPAAEVQTAIAVDESLTNERRSAESVKIFPRLLKPRVV